MMSLLHLPNLMSVLVHVSLVKIPKLHQSTFFVLLRLSPRTYLLINLCRKINFLLVKTDFDFECIKSMGRAGIELS